MSTPTPPEVESLTEEQYDERFAPIPNAEGSDIWEHAETLTHPIDHVWSVVEVDDGDLCAIPGYHVVNVIGYNVTTQPWPHEQIDVTFWNPHDDHEGDCSEGCVV